MSTDKMGFIRTAWQKLKKWNHGFWHWYVGIFKGRPWYIKTLSGIGTFFVCLIIFVLMVSTNFLWLFGKSPSLEAIMHPKTSNVSYVYSADGQLLCKYFDENRTPVKYEEVTPQFYKALIDTEDERFYSHHGIDFGGLLAAGKDFIIHGKARGASTITQQLVKNMFKVRTQYSTGLLGKIPGLRILIMKTKECILATEVEMFYSKKEILTMYVNTVDFGNNSWGIKTAAHSYYNTTPDSLSIDECASLVGLLKATSSYNPRKNPKRSMERRNVVLNNMVIHGDLSQAEYDRLKNIPTPLDLKFENPDDGKALYFRNAISEEMKDWCEANDINFFTDGLKIYTTLDTRIQAHAEEAVMEQMYVIQNRFNHRFGINDPCWLDEEYNEIPNFVENTAATTDYFKQLQSKYPGNSDSVWYYMKKPREMKLFEYQKEGGKVVASYKTVNMSPLDSVAHMLHYMHTGLIAMDPRNGFVKAWVGDVDYTTWKYDKVRSMRQPGSTFKLFVYTAAMEAGLTPCDRELDDYLSMQVYNEKKHEMEDYAPHNANGTFTGQQMTFRQAFVESINVVAIRAGQRVGFDNVAAVAQSMGIESPLKPETAQKAKPSMCLGAMDVNLEELTSAYCTVANYGYHVKPVLVTRITRTTSDGKEEEIYNYKDNIVEDKAIKARSAYLMQKMLEAGITDAGGTSQPLDEWVRPYMRSTDFGGKTGTSNNHSDAWFVGVTPYLVTGVWVGGEYRCIHFTSGAQGQGSRTALPICGSFFEKVWGDKELRPFVTAKFIPLKFPSNAFECDRVYEDRSNNNYQPIDSLGGEEGGDGITNPDEFENPDDNGGNGGGNTGGGNGGGNDEPTEPGTESIFSQIIAIDPSVWARLSC